MFGEPPDGAAIGADTFQRLVAAVRRAVAAHRFRGEPEAIATQLWAAVHGIASLYLLSAFPPGRAAGTLADLAGTLFVGFGDDRAAAHRSIAWAMEHLPGDVRDALR